MERDAMGRWLVRCGRGEADDEMCCLCTRSLVEEAEYFVCEVEMGAECPFGIEEEE